MKKRTLPFFFFCFSGYLASWEWGAFSMKYGRDHAKGPIRKEGNKRDKREGARGESNGPGFHRRSVGFDRNSAVVNRQPTAVEKYWKVDQMVDRPTGLSKKCRLGCVNSPLCKG